MPAVRAVGKMLGGVKVAVALMFGCGVRPTYALRFFRAMILLFRNHASERFCHMAAINNNAAGRKRILLLATGGTIACAAGVDGLTPGLTGEQLAEFVPELADLSDIDVRQVMNIDSSNMQPTDWLTLVVAIRDAYDAYDGFVVLHGTDTMSYTAAALSCLMGGLAKPVVLTGSQLPMTDLHTDARRNLFDAVCSACDNVACGVMVVFAGRIIDGLRARKARTRSFDAFESVNAPDLGKVAGGEVVWAGKPAAPAIPTFHMQLNPRVQVLKITPATNAAIIEALRP